MKTKEQKKIIFYLIISFIFATISIGFIVTESQPDIHSIFKRLFEGFIVFLFAYSIFFQQEN